MRVMGFLPAPDRAISIRDGIDGLAPECCTAVIAVHSFRNSQ
jgi:hypothetical protein